MQLFKFFCLGSLVLILTACSGGGSGNDSSGQAVYNSSGQALLGPVVGASVDLYTLNSLTSPVCTTVTTDSTVLEEAGLIRFDDECLREDGPFIVVVSGGSDIDADDDGQIDSAPTAISGAINALLTAEQIRGQDWHINILTHAIYARVRYMLALGMEQADVLASLAPLTSELLLDDVNADGAIDYVDALAWSPRRSDIRLNISAAAAKGLTDSVHTGTSREFLALNQLGRMGIVYPTESFTQVFSVVGDRAYLCAADTLEIVDISRPQDLSRIALYPDLHFASFSRFGLSACAATSDGYVYYMGIFNDSMSVMETSGSSAIKETQITRDVLSAIVVARVIADRLYLITYDLAASDPGYNLEIYDIKERLEPRLLSITQLNGYARNIALGASGILYLPTSNGELLLLDATNGASPEIVGRFEFMGIGTSVAVQDERAYLSITEVDDNGRSTQSKLLTLDISVPANIRLIGEDIPVGSWLGSLQVSGSSLLGFQTDEDSGVQIVEFGLSDPDAPERTGAVIGSDIGDPSADFQLHNGTIFAISDGTRFQSLPLPVADPGLLSIEPTQGKAYGLRIKDKVAYVAVRGVGLYVIDVAEPTSPETISLRQGEDERNTLDLALNGDTLLLLGQMMPHGTRLMDISDPLSVAQIGNIEMGDQSWTRAEGGVIKDNIAYLASDALGLFIADISDPSRPQTLAEFPLPDGRGEYSEIGISGDYLLALDEGSGMDIIDISNPSQPVVVSSYTSTLGEPDNIWTPANVEVAGGFAYITQIDFIFSGDFTNFEVEVIGGLEVVDISNPLSPTFVSTVNTSGKSLSVAISDNLVFVRDTAGAIDIVDITDPVQPKLLHSIRIPDTLGPIAVDGNVIYVTGVNGLYAYVRPRFDDLP